MLKYLVGYAATTAFFVAIDYVWLSLAAPSIYRPRLGTLLLDQPNLAVAAAFYLVYCVVAVILVVIPAANAGSLAMAIGFGALLGLAAYGTYDFTNLATIRGWSGVVTAIDLVWGMTLTAGSSAVGYLAVRLVDR